MDDNSTPLSVVSDDFHPRFDRSNKQHVARLVSLLLKDWRLEKGQGPRNHDFCLYCRGDLTHDCEIFVHEDGQCRNGWPLSCFLEWLEIELAGGRPIRCPVCRATIVGPNTLEAFCRASEPRPDPPVALLRFALFSPDFVLQCGLLEKRPIIFMEHSTQNNLSKKLFNGDAALFSIFQAITHRPGSPNIEFNLLCYQYPDTPSPSTVFPALVLVDCGHNIFRMCTFLPREMEDLRSKLVAGGANVRLMSGDSFDRAAELNGGLALALNGIAAGDLDIPMGEMEKNGMDFMSGIYTKRVQWEQEACFYLLKAMCDAGIVHKGNENPRFNAFLLGLMQSIPAHHPLFSPMSNSTTLFPGTLLASNFMNAGNGTPVANSNTSNAVANPPVPVVVDDVDDDEEEIEDDDNDDDEEEDDDGDDDYDDDDDSNSDYLCT